MDPRLVRGAGLACALVYGAFIVWLYARQPASLPEVSGGVASVLGAYRTDPDELARGLRFFRNEMFEEARAAFERADPARQDARVQFYVAYSYYRQGWGRTYSDDALFRKGLDALDRAISVAPSGLVVVEDPGLAMQSGDELGAELRRGLSRDLSDLNPLRLLRERK
jgi:tetratricopeptide (TPR) repeat protein